MKKYLFYTLLFLFISIFHSNNALAFEIEEATIRSIHTAIKKQELNCEQLINAYLERIKKYNLAATSAPPINALTEINTSVMDEARRLDAYFAKTKKLIGPLHCIPVLIKDNIDTTDMTTTTGSFALLGNQAIQDAFLVTRMRDAGAIILAKSGMDEFAWGMFGISSRSGRIGNAYDTRKNPGGSSGGSAAGVSANFAVIGIGTDNSGSVRIPAAFNGLVGLRPSTGLISQRGIFPMGNLDGAAGPMARTTTDLAIALDTLTITPDLLDIKTVNVPRIKTYTAFLNPNGLQNKRIGIVRRVGKMNTFENMPKEIQQMINQSWDKMRALGATFIEINLPEFNNARDDNQAGEIEEVNAYLAAFPATRKNFRDICESNRTRTFGKNIKKCLRWMASIPEKNSREYQTVLTTFKKNKQVVHKIMATKKLDALFIPISTGGSATYDGEMINTWRAPISSNAGLPSIAINIGYDKKQMPVGVEFIAKQFNEGVLIEIAYAYEVNSAARLVPVLPVASEIFNHFSIPAYNHFIAVLGQQAFEKILMPNKSNKNIADVLTPIRFQQIIRDCLVDKSK